MSSSSSSSDGQRKKNKKSRVNKSIPVMDQIFKIKPKQKEIVINLKMTKYEVIADIAEELGWNIQYNSKKGDWDVLWVDHMIEPETLIKMNFFQKISHFPGIHVLARKNLLGLTLMQMKKKFGDDYKFVPYTWMLPKDFSSFRLQVQTNQKLEQDNKKWFIVKPQADCQGRGIFLTCKTDEVENGKHYVIQQYIHKPFLVEGLKFDFRVYVLLCGTNPMRLYVYEQGLARFATEKYQPPNKNNLSKLFMHLTNYAINKKNPKYVYNSSVNNMASGHKRSLTSVLNDLKRRGFNVQSLKDKIDDALVKTILIGMPLVSHQYKFCQPDDQSKNMCFHILGVDVMIDELLNPIVLEVNHTPSFATDTPLDYFIKYNLIKDTLILMNINEQNKKQLIKKTNQYRRQRITNAKKLIQTKQQRQKMKQGQQIRDEYENKNLGKYRKVYPVENQEIMKKYNQYQQFAEKTYFSENNWIRSEIQAEKQKIKKNDTKQSMQKKQRIVPPPARLSNLKHYNSYFEKPKAQEQQYRQRKLSPEYFQAQLKDHLIQRPLRQALYQNPLKAYSACFEKKKKQFIEQDVSSTFSSPIKIKSLKQSRKKIIMQDYFDQKIVLPKIQPHPTMKPYTKNIKKNKYQTLKRRMSRCKQFEGFNKAEKYWNEEDRNGKFLIPKIMRFDDQSIMEFMQK